MVRRSPTMLRPVSRLLIATDFTPGAALAASRAARLPLGSRPQVTLLHVLRVLRPALRTRERAEAKRRLEHAAVHLRRELRAQGHRQARVSVRVAVGEAAAEIAARSRGRDLVVLGRHGTRRFRDLLIGSTAERVIRAGHVPVLIVTTAARRTYRRPLVGVDLSPPSRRALDTAARLLPPGSHTLSVLHVYEAAHDSLLRRVAGPAEAAAYARSCRAEAARQVEALVAGSAGRAAVREVLLRRGDPRATILSVVREQDVDLLAVGSHARSPLAGSVLGSVAEAVMRHAGCDALIVPPA